MLSPVMLGSLRTLAFILCDMGNPRNKSLLQEKNGTFFSSAVLMSLEGKKAG